MLELAALALHFSLPDTAGRLHTEREWAGKRAVVLVFTTTDCPIGNRYVPELNRIAREYAARGVALFGVHSDPSQTPEEVRRYARGYRLEFPLLYDRTLHLARAIGATVTPESAVLSPGGTLLYLGRIDDRVVDFGQTRRQPTRRDLRLAIEAVLAGRPIHPDRTRAVGCAISFHGP